jgi:alternate signal-mediated exported protein
LNKNMNTAAIGATKAGARGRLKGAGKVALGAALCAGLLTSGGTYAGWNAAESLQGAPISTGEVSLSTEAKWFYNGDVVDQAELGALVLSPGDAVTWGGQVTPTVTGTNSVKNLEFAGVDGLQAVIDAASTAGGSIAVLKPTVADGAGGWVDSREISAAESGAAVTAQFDLIMAPEGDPAYGDGSVGQNLDLNLDQIDLVLR